ncbi:mitochondrial nucleotide exchange factor MGE1 Ecym_8338 [Eremothecium cymbalariae DBVPG|uniref:GrpE protein homolog n=1 Tax=Eremothecium cymbalariae (strain CBS 270.75 / DBVPG 7215 / KCTC 17166 / NRRL Y-17582) TaxID=931890 RepID=G8JXP2_ERECY|nr:Hypothetical protein Ecym_8338 [Eremothecium cymbalariae DBVPG\
MRQFSSLVLRSRAAAPTLRAFSSIRVGPAITTYGGILSTRVQGLRFYSEEAKKSDSDAAASEKESEGVSVNGEQKRINELEEILASKSKEVTELKDRLLRSIADFRNLQEVTKKDVQKAKDFALQKFARDLLESVDNFGHALNAFKPESVEESKEIADLYDGVKMTRDVFERTLKKHGIEKLEPLGEEFDPNKHEATFEVPQADKKPGTICHVQQIGFTLNNRVIRPAKVGVVKDNDTA